jgi:hypothetical protein
MYIVFLLCFLNVVFAETHFADYVDRCDDLVFENGIILFTSPNKDGRLNIIMNSLSDSFRAMMLKPQISYGDCVTEINIKPLFVQFDKYGDVARILDPRNPPAIVKTEMDIFYYFVESATTTRVNKAVRVDFSGRSALAHLHAMEKHNEFVLAVLPRKNYNENLAKYVEWVQEQPYNRYEFQYVQEHRDEMTSIFLANVGHLQSKYVTLDEPVYYLIRKQKNGEINTRKYKTLGDLEHSTTCDEFCVHGHCIYNTEKCEFKLDWLLPPKACKEDIDCNGGSSDAYRTGSYTNHPGRR